VHTLISQGNGKAGVDKKEDKEATPWARTDKAKRDKASAKRNGFGSTGGRFPVRSYQS
jgi:hypothetical protein